MLPVVFDPRKVRIGIAGAGEALARRLAMLKASDATPVHLSAPADVARVDVLFVAGLGPERARAFADAARSLAIPVNVEDVPELCDFHVPASVRRGDLLITVSTGGRSPGLARAIRAALERIFGEEWTSRSTEIAGLRASWREQGLAPSEVSSRIAAHVHDRGWLQ